LVAAVGKDHAVLINAGDIFKNAGFFKRERAGFILRTYALMGYDVIVPGPDDFVYGADFLKQKMDSSPINLVCANLSLSVKGVPVCLPYVRLQRGSARILITGIIDPEFTDKGPLAAHLDSLSEPVSALRKVLNLVAHDLAIVVVHATKPRMQEIISPLDGKVDVVISGTLPGTMAKLGHIGTALLVGNNLHGKTVAALDLPAQKLQVKTLAVKKVLADPKITELIRVQLRWEWEKRREQKIIEQSQSRKVVPGSNFYLGQDWCQRCHAKVHKAWQGTAHARAIDILRQRKRATDPDCFPCHVTGMPLQGKPAPAKVGGGFVSLQRTPYLVNVQCEACHGPGGHHCGNPKKFKMKLGDESGCRGCHTADTDPDFHFQNPHKQ